MEFDQQLRSFAAELELPEPRRSRFLLELRADLEDLARTLVAEGLGREEAHRRALEALLPSADAVAELEGLHRPLYRRLLDRFSEPARGRVERGLLVALSVLAVAVGMVGLSRFDLLADPSVFLWPILALAAAIAVTGGAKLFQLYVARGGGPERLRRGLSWLPALALVALVVGFGGAAVDLYLVAGRIAVDVSAQGRELLDWLRRDMALLASALLIASGAGLLWLVAAIRIARIETLEAEALGFHVPNQGRST